jgi:MFS family permease
MATQNKSVLLQISAAVIGNALEWYDFIVFGLMTAVIATVFFPSESAYSSLLLTTASFGVGFFLRPVGGILIGAFSDRRGRRAALQLIIALMTVATALIAFAPPYAAIGLGSSLIIVVARMLQGLATGGEFASATAFLIEIAPPGRRGLYGSWQMFGQGLAMLLGAGIGTLITHVLSHDQLYAWGWRVPFIVGLLIAPVGFWIRQHLQETAFQESTSIPGAKRDQKTAQKPVSMGKELLGQPRALIGSLLLTCYATISLYILAIYMPTYANKSLHIPLGDAFAAQCIGILAMIAVTPLFGALSDRVGRRPLIQAALLVFLVIVVPCFSWLIASPSEGRFMLMQVVLCGVFGAVLGPFSTAIAEQFSTRVRSTGMAISYNIAVMVFGGFAQLIVTWLLHVTGSLLTPAFYLVFGTVAGLCGSFLLVSRVTDRSAAPSFKPVIKA